MEEEGGVGVGGGEGRGLAWGYEGLVCSIVVPPGWVVWGRVGLGILCMCLWPWPWWACGVCGVVCGDWACCGLGLSVVGMGLVLAGVWGGGWALWEMGRLVSVVSVM